MSRASTDLRRRDVFGIFESIIIGFHCILHFILAQDSIELWKSIKHFGKADQMARFRKSRPIWTLFLGSFQKSRTVSSVAIPPAA